MAVFNTVWKTENFRPDIHWQDLEKNVKILRKELIPEDFKKCFSLLNLFASNALVLETLEDDIKWMSEQPKKACKAVIQKLVNCCNLEGSIFDEYETIVPPSDRYLPHPGSVNARFMLYCLENEMPCPEGDVGTVVNARLRNTLFEIIEMALRTRCTYKIAENNFLKQFIRINDRDKTVLTSRDFFDSLVFYANTDPIDLIPPQLATSEAVCTFFDKMRQLSTFSNNEEPSNNM